MEQYLMLVTVVNPQVGSGQLCQYKEECEQLRILLHQTLSEVLKKEEGESTYSEIRLFKHLLYCKSKSKKRGIEEDLFEVFGRLRIPTQSSEDTVWTLLLHLAAVTKLLNKIDSLL